MCGEDERSIYRDIVKWRRLVTGNIFFFFSAKQKTEGCEQIYVFWRLFLSLSSSLDFFPF